MKAITLYQPHASLMAIFEKKIETRPRRWRYFGPVAIHAGLYKGWLNMARLQPFAKVLSEGGFNTESDLPLGAVIAVGQMIGSVETEVLRDNGHYLGATLTLPHDVTPQEIAFGDYTAGRWGYVFASMRRLRDPIPTAGHQGIWEWEPPANLEGLYV